VALISGALLLGPTTSAAAQTATGTPQEKAAAIIRPSIVYIEQYWTAWVRVPRSSGLNFLGYVNGGQPFSWGTRCSGFVVSPAGYVVTAGHCVDVGEEGARGTALEFAVQWLVQEGWLNAGDSAAALNEAHMLWGVEGTESGSDADLEVWIQRGVAAGGLKTGDALPARVVDYQPWSQGDVALLKAEAEDLPVALVAPSSSIDIGTEVLSVGYPGSTDMVTDQSFEPTYKDGQINAEKTREGGLLPVYEMSAALSGGMSGGPTVDLDGAVVGVNSFSIVGETEAFNFITPSSLVAEMLGRNGVTNELSSIDEAYRAGVEDFYAADYEGAIASFDEVLGLSPTHQQAQEMKVKATKLLAEQPPAPVEEKPVAAAEGGFPWVIVAIALLVLMAGGAAAMFLRRKKAPAPIPAGLASVPMPAPAVAPVPTPAGFRPAASPPASVPKASMAQASVPTMAASGNSSVASPAEPAEESRPHFCANCGQGLQAAVRFCPDCGAQVI
jgi:S1-C subfamily serine protease